MSYEIDPKGVQLTPEQAKSRRLRNIAIGLILCVIVVLFYAVTIVKVGPGVTKPPI